MPRQTQPATQKTAKAKDPTVIDLVHQLDDCRASIQKMESGRFGGYYNSDQTKRTALDAAKHKLRVIEDNLRFALDSAEMSQARRAQGSVASIESRLAYRDALTVSGAAFASGDSDAARLEASLAIVRARGVIVRSARTRTERHLASYRVAVLSALEKDLLDEVAPRSATRRVVDAVTGNSRRAAGLRRKQLAQDYERRTGERWTPEVAER
jgi:hypothetical protein